MNYVILGNGPAGVIAAETIRQTDPSGTVTLVGDEPEPPYSRMAIPYLLIGSIDEAGTYLRKDKDHFARQRIDLLRARATRELPERLRQLANQFGLRFSRVSIRNQQSRWGSCSPNGHVCLNWRLVTMPDWVRDYVIIHELMHVKRLDHSPKFWKLVAAACPTYQEARAWLRQYQGMA